MKIKVAAKSYEEVLKLPVRKHKKPLKPNMLLAFVVRVLSFFTLLGVGFKYSKIGMERLGRKEPALILMNHSSFIDLKIASALLFPKRYNIIMTSDGFVGKNLLMRLIGCVPTQKFTADSVLVRNIFHCIKKNKTSVLMYPEASYSFDGTATTLPESLGKLVIKLGVPVIMIKTMGAFAYDPLYNGLQLRKTKVSAEMKYLLSPEEIESKSFEEINRLIGEEFTFDNFRWQQENGIRITENFRADYLNRVLYKCPDCKAEGQTEGKGTTLTCKNCGKVYELTEEGFMRAVDGETEFSHIPDWFSWQRECVREEIKNGKYNLELRVKIMMLIDSKKLYDIGMGTLIHNINGFRLLSDDKKLDYHQAGELSYSLYSDFYWYELGDIICIGNSKALYYCFPQKKGDIVAKTRLATEEIYKIRTAKA